MKILCQLYDYLFLLISCLRSISVYKSLVDTSSLMCLACYMAKIVGFFGGGELWGCYIYVWRKLNVNIYPKIIGGLNIIGNIPGIFLKKTWENHGNLSVQKCGNPGTSVM